MRALICVIGAAALCASAAQGVIITSQGDLTDGLYVNGTTPFTNFANAPSQDFAYFTLSCNAGDVIDVEVNRTVNGNMDPICFAFLGNAIGLDSSDVINITTINGLTLVGGGDDDEPPAIPGPFGDPRFSFIAPASGVYTLVVSNFLGNAIDEGFYHFEIRATGSTVPAPGAAALLGLGLIAAGRRRR